MRHAVLTEKAPAPIGSYSQAIQAGKTIYLSGQIPLDAKTGALIQGDITFHILRVFENLQAVAEAAGGTLNHIVKLTVYLLDLSHVSIVNEVMADFFQQPFPARTTLGVAALPKGAAVEVEAIMVIGQDL